MCKDADDQKFIDLAAVRRRAILLEQKDKAVICMRKRLVNLGADVATEVVLGVDGMRIKYAHMLCWRTPPCFVLTTPQEVHQPVAQPTGAGSRTRYGMNISQTVDELLAAEVQRRYWERWNATNQEAIGLQRAHRERACPLAQYRASERWRGLTFIGTPTPNSVSPPLLAGCAKTSTSAVCRHA